MLENGCDKSRDKLFQQKADVLLRDFYKNMTSKTINKGHINEIMGSCVCCAQHKITISNEDMNLKSSLGL